MITHPGYTSTESIIPFFSPLDPKAPNSLRPRDSILTQKMQLPFLRRGSLEKFSLNPINLGKDDTREGGELHGMSRNVVKRRVSKSYSVCHT